MPRYRFELDGSRYKLNPESGEWVLIEGAPVRESEDTSAEAPETEKEDL